MRKATLLWIAGLLTLVPWATWYLLFSAPRTQYALLITFVLFWIFGYWGVVGPILALVKVRAVFRAMEGATSRAELAEVLQSAETRDVVIAQIATDNHIPRFLAVRVYEMLARGIAARSVGGSQSSAGSIEGRSG